MTDEEIKDSIKKYFICYIEQVFVIDEKESKIVPITEKRLERNNGP